MQNVFQDILNALKNLFDGDMSDKDLTAKLDEMSAGKNLNWRLSLVDLLKLLGIDSSAENREELGKELGVTAPGTAAGNEELRKALFKRIADAGGNVPSDLTD